MRISSQLNVLLTPAEFKRLPEADLSQTVCVVFDILRATTTITTALHHGAKGIIPVAEIPEALALKIAHPDILLAGERNGVRIGKELTGDIEFDFGNSPREFTRERVQGRTIGITTTNGTRALRACATASKVIIASFPNLGAVVSSLRKNPPTQLLLVCSGTGEESAAEDALAAGAVAEALWDLYSADQIADSAEIARQFYKKHASNLLEAMAHSRNGRRLLKIPELKEDLEICLARDTVQMVPELKKGGRITN